MKVKDLKDRKEFEVFASEDALEQPIEGVFIGDLLSWVMGHGEVNQAWITIQGHLNVVAIAALKEFSCIIVAQGASVESNVIEKAFEENIALIKTSLSAYEVAKLLNSKGV